VLRRIFGPKKEDVAGAWRIMDEIHILYVTSNIIRVIKSRMMRWVGHIMDERSKKCIEYLVEKPYGKKPHE